MKARLTVTHAALLLGIRERALVSLARAGKIPHRKFGRDYTFDEDQLQAWVAAQPGVDPPASLPATPVVTSRDPVVPEGTAEPPIALVRGPTGQHRRRLKERPGTK